MPAVIFMPITIDYADAFLRQMMPLPFTLFDSPYFDAAIRHYLLPIRFRFRFSLLPPLLMLTSAASFFSLMPPPRCFRHADDAAATMPHFTFHFSYYFRRWLPGCSRYFSPPTPLLFSPFSLLPAAITPPHFDAAFFCFFTLYAAAFYFDYRRRRQLRR